MLNFDLRDLTGGVAKNTLNKKISPQLKLAKRNISTFDKLIVQAEKMAQELGVKIPTASFSRMRERLKKYI